MNYSNPVFGQTRPGTLRSLLTASLLTLSLLGAPGARAADSISSWLQVEVGKSTSALLANISPEGAARGAVVASPSRNDPNYYYYWVRDGALVMSAVVGLYERATAPAEKTRYLAMLRDFADFSRANQKTPNRSGPPGETGLGEPKFNADGSAFQGDWARPQNDGPALRALTLVRFAEILLARGEAEYVRSRLYDGRIPSDGVIKADLEFVSHHWRETCFDLWEEVKGHHFYTRLVQRRALLEGAKLAERLGDPGAAGWYRQQAGLLELELERFWEPRRGYLVTALDRDGGLDYKHSGIDSSVILGVLHADSPNHKDELFGATDDRVLATAERIQAAFRESYAINRREIDFEGLSLSPGIGRYPEDHYNGYTTSSQGNPWFLATHAFAELHYRAARGFERAGEVPVTDRNLTFLKSVSLAAQPAISRPIQAGETISSDDPRFGEILNNLRRAGDSYLRRTRLHSNPDGSLSEQMNRDTGFMQGARDLSWSYASLLTAAWDREE